MATYSELLINLLGAFLILILGLIIAQIFSNILRKFLRGIGINTVLEEQLKVKMPLENYISALLKYLIYFVTIIIVLGKLAIPTKVLQIILIMLIILIVVFIVLAFKDWLPNIVSGFYLLRTQKIKNGEIIKIKDLKGKIIAINLLETKIETVNNEIIFIPNSNITNFEVIKEK